MNTRMRPFLRAVSSGLGLAMLLSACLTAPRADLATQVPHISAWFSDPAPERGALINAVPLPMESALRYLDLVNTGALFVKINLAPLKDAGFFKKLEYIRSSVRPVRQIRLHYWSEDASGRPIKLSGMVYLPADREGVRLSVPLLLLCHGTQALRDRVPSRLQGSERPLAVIAAATGCAVVMPDYPGMGDGEGFHPYCHARSLAHCGVDMLRATRALLNLPEVTRIYEEAPFTFVCGYSEGGYAAMAVARELEREANGEFPVKAAFPMAGPFDMSTTMRLFMAEEKPVAEPYYLPYTILGWSSVYPGLSPSAVLRREYLDAIAPVFDGRSPSRVINEAIAKTEGTTPGKVVAAHMLTGEYRDALVNPKATVLGETASSILKDNDLFDWPADPSIPLYLMAARGDELVPFENSAKAFRSMTARGVKAELRELDQATHEYGGYEAYGIMLLTLWDILGI